MYDISSLWIDGDLGPIEQASARSFLRFGHKFTIYTYGKLNNVPQGVKVRDANEILPATKIAHHKKRDSPALQADLFRLQLMHKTNELWVDLDIIALKSFDFEEAYIFGYETPTSVNNAVLRLPKTSKTLHDLSQFTAESRGVPPQLQGSRRFRYQIKNLLSGGLSIEKWPWGSIGPRGLTHFLSRNDEVHHAKPIDVFYPIPLSDVKTIAKPNAMRIQDFSDDCYAVHLWNSHLKGYLASNHNGKIPENSLLMELTSL